MGCGSARGRVFLWNILISYLLHVADSTTSDAGIGSCDGWQSSPLNTQGFTSGAPLWTSGCGPYDCDACLGRRSCDSDSGVLDCACAPSYGDGWHCETDGDCQGGLQAGKSVCEGNCCVDAPCPATVAASGTTPSAVESATGTGIAVTCAIGYSTTGTATCNADNSWTLPDCTANACTATKVANSDKAADDSITGTTGQAVTVACDAGYSGSGDATCQTEGVFSTVICKDSTQVANTCTCANGGTAATGIDCTTDGDNICTACSGDFYLNGDSCDAWTICSPGQTESATHRLKPSNTQDRVCTRNVCKCANGGTVAAGNDCTTAAGNICTACFGNFYLNGAHCDSWLVCPPGETEISSPSNTQDRVCTNKGGEVVDLDPDLDPDPEIDIGSGACGDDGYTGDAGACNCADGYGGTVKYGAESISGCTICGTGTWAPEGNGETCTAIACGDDGYTGMAGSCSCDAGYEGTVVYSTNEAAGCTAVTCPDFSNGTVPGNSGTGNSSGCTITEPGYSGKVTATRDSLSDCVLSGTTKTCGNFYTSSITAVGCPDNSYGPDVPTGCTTDAGYAGKVIATTVFPFYAVQTQSGMEVAEVSSTAVGCPTNTAGKDVPTGCTANEGYAGQVLATTVFPFYSIRIQSGESSTGFLYMVEVSPAAVEESMVESTGSGFPNMSQISLMSLVFAIVMQALEVQ